ncbi:MAG: hypothetical protein ABS20_04040 [SAR86 cluster bacterium BACL1 MAG-121022-bin58]|nr:MAG: hypothetical protein ABS20_04040 [SAR86 cluster bacterium BACL1 MAG-121022-bin58]KRP22942.1 MAG: hypothetical protein ABS19_04040 [SAR86 cluster bacterium BACL1 MAG-121015-bin70]
MVWSDQGKVVFWQNRKQEPAFPNPASPSIKRHDGNRESEYWLIAAFNHGYCRSIIIGMMIL